MPLGFAQLALGRVEDAQATLQEFSKVDALGASHAAAGLGDIAIYQGRYRDAVRILEKGVAADIAEQQPDRAASKLAAIAYAELRIGSLNHPSRPIRGARTA